MGRVPSRGPRSLAGRYHGVVPLRRSGPREKLSQAVDGRIAGMSEVVQAPGVFDGAEQRIVAVRGVRYIPALAERRGEHRQDVAATSTLPAAATVRVPFVVGHDQQTVVLERR